MKSFPYVVIFLSVALVGCTDLSKVEEEDKKNPLEAETMDEGKAEPVAVVAQKSVTYPFERVVKDATGRSIEARILAKLDSRIGFEKLSGNQKFIIPLDRLSEEDQAFYQGIYDGGDFQAVSDAIDKAARLGDREAAWNRDIVSAEREAEKLKLPRMTLFLIAGDPQSKSLGSNLLFSRNFRKWAGQNLVLCSIPVEPPGTRMAITSAMAENRRVAELYNVLDRPMIALDIPGKKDFTRVPLDDITTVEDVIEAVEKVLSKQRR